MPRFSTVDMLRHYEKQKADYPWKHEGTPPDVQVLVEGVLGDGKTGLVVQRWQGVFGGVESAQDWLDRPASERRLRVKGLSHVEPVDWLAEELLECRRQDGLTLKLVERAKTWFPAAMALLRFGTVAYPVNNVVRRVSSRIGGKAEELIKGLVLSAHDARFTASGGALPALLPPAYRVVSAFLDIADNACRLWVMQCIGCRLREGCDKGMSLKS